MNVGSGKTLTLGGNMTGSGTINGVSIGQSVAGAGSFTTLSASGNTTFTNAPVLSSLTASQAVFTTAGKALTSNAITGTGNVVMSASPTLTGTVSAAAATLSSDLTLNGGTANGVLYLDGSKVAASGSALTFDGTNLGVGTSSPASLTGGASTGVAFNGSSSVELDLATAGVRRGYFYADSNAAEIGTVTGSIPIKFAIGLSEAMRLTSTSLYTASGINVGIGTSSPNRKLEVNGISRFTDGTTNAEIACGGGVAYIGPQTNSPLAFQTNNTERMRLDSSGNLGLGVTPSAWSSASRVLDVGNGAQTDGSFVSGFYGLTLARNAYYDGTNWKAKYTATEKPTKFTQPYAGGFVWSIATGSVTANTNFTFSDAMTLDASGRLMIGGTSPDGILTLGSTSYGTGIIYQSVKNNGGILIVGVESSTGGGLANGTSGYAAVINQQNNYSLSFATNNTERARITSSGDFGIGTNSPAYKLDVRSSSGTSPVTYISNGSTSGNVEALRTSLESNGNNTSSYHLNAVTQTVNNWYLYGNGTTSFSSDERLKKDIETTRDGYLDDVMKLRVVKYRWWNQEESEPRELGLIAQEVEQVFPGLVQEHELEGVGMRKNIKHSVMEFILIKAIQELKSELDSVKAELAILKGN
jgi:hypothetical protein